MSDKPTAVRVYLARVRTALADLPASEIEEILEDVRPHLAELEAELGEGARVEALIERLGSPESYAAELRASGGYPAPGEGATQVIATAAPSTAKPRIALWGLVFCALGLALLAFGATVSRNPDSFLGLLLFAPVFFVSLTLLLRGGVEPVLALPEVAWLRTKVAKGREQEDTGKFLRYAGSLKPAWWVVCAIVLVSVGLLLMLRHGSAVLLLPFLILAAVGALWVGPRVRTDRRLLWMAVPISAFVVGSILGGFGAAIDLFSRGSSPSPSYYPSSADHYGNDQLTYGGREVENVYAFDAEGKPLTEVYLYDDEGRPLTLTRYGCERSSGSRQKIGEDNRFPRPKIEQGVTDDQGNYNGYNGYRGACRELAGVPFSAAIPKVTVPPTAATPTPTPPTR